MKQDTIHINIWDDFSDSDLEEDGKKTYAYVESDLNDNESKEVLTLVQQAIEKYIPHRTFYIGLVFLNPRSEYTHITDIQEDDDDLFSEFWKIEFTNIDYHDLNYILDTIKPLELTYKNIPLNIYSES